jgi:hypothetical protein
MKKLDWNDLLEKIGLIEFDLSPHNSHRIFLNIRIEENDYSFSIEDLEQAKKLPPMRISQELKDEIKSRARERLASMDDFLNFVDRSTAKKIVFASAALATFDTIQKAIT